MGVKSQGLCYTAYPPLHTYHFCLSQFLSLAISTESQPQLILLVLHFASHFLFLSALTVSFSSAYFSASPVFSLCLLQMTLFPSVNFSFVPLSLENSFLLFKSPLKSTHGFELSIDSRTCSQRLGEI